MHTLLNEYPPSRLRTGLLVAPVPGSTHAGRPEPRWSARLPLSPTPATCACRQQTPGNKAFLSRCPSRKLKNRMNWSTDRPYWWEIHPTHTLENACLAPCRRVPLDTHPFACILQCPLCCRSARPQRGTWVPYRSVSRSLKRTPSRETEPWVTA